MKETLKIIEKFLDQHKEHHFNFEQDYTYVVSSGSLRLDIEMGGGIRPGILRLCGVSEGGKSSAALIFARNFQLTVENSMVHYIKAEGRLSNDMIERAGVITAPERWQVFKCNIYETVIDYIRNLDKNNPEDVRHMFVIDSMDALVRKEDLDRPVEEANKVAGNQLLSSDFMRKMALSLGSHGHICVLISQVRSTVKLNPYEKGDANKSSIKTTASGGNALLHYSDWILEFTPRWNNDIIWEDEKTKEKSLGHYCKIEFRKTPNEKTGVKVKYPIKYGQVGGKSVWREYEVVDEMMVWDMVVKKASWFNFSEEIRKEVMEETKIELPEKVQGMDALRKIFEDNDVLTNYLFNKFKTVLQKT